jgi:hypothetical protein
MAHHVKDDFRNVLAPNAVLVMETIEFLLDVPKDKMAEFSTKVSECVCVCVCVCVCACVCVCVCLIVNLRRTLTSDNAGD